MTMTLRKQLSAASPWVNLSAEDSDWQRADANLLKDMLVQTHMIRAFEETVLNLAGQGLIHGPAHSSIGQEGAAVASVLALKLNDVVNGSHRGHHQFLAKALGYVAPNGLDPIRPFNDAVRNVLRRSLAEICGLSLGYCKGRGGSMHLQWMSAGAAGTNAIVGGGVPQAAGFAWSHKHSKSDAVTVTYFGDGAVNIGSVLETFNIAAAWHLPLCFFIENNHYAVATRVDEVTAEPRLSARGLGFNIPSWQVDGMDPLAVYVAMQEAIDHMRSGLGPTIIEADVYRYFHQNGQFPGSAFGYRTKEEEEQWRKRDPLLLLANRLANLGLVSHSETVKLKQFCQSEMNQIVEELVELEPADDRTDKRRIRPELWPDPEFRDVGVRGDLSEFSNVHYEELPSFSGTIQDQRFVDVIAKVLYRRMSVDKTVVVLGEDIHRLKGGTNGATRGLFDAFPDRVLGTPISENAFVGLAGGMALDGRYKPIVEFMYADFVWVAADQVFNQIGKARHMFGGDANIPLVLRTKVAMGSGYGSQHSMDPAGIFATCPGWRIVAPSTPFDYVGLMNSALLCNDPVLVIEHVDLYNTKGPAPADDLDYFIPVGRANVRRVGSDLTILTYLSMVNHSLEAADACKGLSAEVIDLRWLDRASIDWVTIEASIKKTNKVLIVEQGSTGTSYGGWLADEIQRRYFDWLDRPVERVTGGEAAPSICKVLERSAIAKTEEVVAKLTEYANALAGHNLPKMYA